MTAEGGLFYTVKVFTCMSACNWWEDSREIGYAVE